MIKIIAESKGDTTELQIEINGPREDIVAEAVHIMEQLPKQLEEMNKGLFLHFLAELTSTGMFAVGMKRVDPEEDAEC